MAGGITRIHGGWVVHGRTPEVSIDVVVDDAGVAREVRKRDIRDIPPAVFDAALAEQRRRQAGRGPGSMLREMLSMTGCACEDWARRMDAEGVAWCVAHRAEIAEAMVGHAAGKRWPVPRLLMRWAALRMVDAAIERFRAQTEAGEP